MGHTKTCLVLAGGFVLWPINDHERLVSNVIGLSIAMGGCILYGHLKLSEGAQRLDVFDRMCLPCGLALLVPRKHSVADDADDDAARGEEGEATPLVESRRESKSSAPQIAITTPTQRSRAE